MKNLPFFSKACVLLFSATLLVACGGNTKEDDEAAAAAAAAAAAEAAAAATHAANAGELQDLQDAAASVGNVFYFEYDSSALTQDALGKLNAHIALLQKTDGTVRLEGHTDERGTREYNLALGERRANSVRDYMAANGIATYRIESVSYGEEKPIAYGSIESNWAQNRRVELK
jgi:peptidoglycan-associated lipoprotein